MDSVNNMDSLRTQAALLRAEKLDVSGLAALGIVPADNLPPAVEPAIDLDAEQIRLMREAGYLGTKAVSATFNSRSVRLIEDATACRAPYLNFGGPPPGNPKLLAAIRSAVSFAILDAPDQIFGYTDIQEIAGQPIHNWSDTNEFLKNWWTRKLVINGQPLIIPTDHKRWRGMRVNPRFDITLAGKPLPVPKRRTR
jgi:hypothetical protein